MGQIGVVDDGWGSFECVTCGALVYTLESAINPEHRCAVCQFIFEAPVEIQDELRQRLNQHPAWVPQAGLG